MFLTHGHCKGGKVSREYQSWRQMLNRCYQRRHKFFSNYGGRGITVCDRWRGSGGFERFLEDMGPRPPGTSLDRIENDGNYEPGNCRWATPKQQLQNRRGTHRITFGGRTMVLADWARELGIASPSLRRRIRRWGLARALTLHGRTDSKLSAFDVRRIRKRIAAGESGVKIARDFGITQSAVSRIRTGSRRSAVA